MSNLEDVINLRDEFFEKQEKLYLGMVNQINSQMKELLKNDLGIQLANNCARDFAGEIVRNYLPLNTGEMYITADQMFDRIINFRYDNDIDPISSNDEIRKMLYNNENSEIFKQIEKESQKAQEKLFTKDRYEDGTQYRINKFRRKEEENNNGILHDDLTGKELDDRDVNVDHIQPRAKATYNSEYIKKEGVDKLQEFYNSGENFQIINQTANKVKNATYNDDPNAMTEEICKKMEKNFKLKEAGYLDEYGNVKPEVKNKLRKNIEDSMNKESKVILENIKYNKVGKTAFKNTINSFPKIFAGQIMYYGIPTMVYETKCIIKNRNTDLDSFFVKLQKAFKRIIAYMQSKLKNIIGNIAHNSLKSFLRNFFYIIIEMLKATVKKIFKMIKDVVMALVNSIKILSDKNRTTAEKADAVVTTLGITISSIAVNVIIEYLEVQFPALKPFTDPLQVIITILTTNIIMLILQKIDIFNVRYGLMVAKIKEIFEEGRAEYKEQLKLLENETYEDINKIMEETEFEIFNVIADIYSADVNEKDLKEEIDTINKTFNMGIDLEEEWNQFAYN